jgi:tetratricopeptide (TPR) repeat protein
VTVVVPKEVEVKLFVKTVLVAVLAALVVGPATAAKERKLPAKAYISSAKIEIIGYAEKKEQERIELAQAMLDSLFLYYGPHTDGYYWYSQIKWDLAKEKADLKERLPLVKEAVAYADSLKWACGNKDIDKRNREKCKTLDEEMDSIRVAEWRDYFNEGVKQNDEITQLMESAKAATDSSEVAYYQGHLEGLVDTCQDNMAIAVAIDSTNPKAFVGLATVNEKTGKYKLAIEYLKRALPKAEDRYTLLTSIAYDYIQDDDYCAAIPWFREYVDSMTTMPQVMEDPTNRAAVIGTAQNLAICYNNCKEYDNAYGVFKHILSFDPQDVTALIGVARYQQQQGRQAGDSARAQREAGNEAASKNWQAVRDQRFDSARVMMKQTFELESDRCEIAAEYGLMAAILQDYDEAKVAFLRATELCPDDVDYWVSLGDCDLQLKDWSGAATAYERVVELKPDNKAVWERLGDLYQQLGNTTKRAEVLKKLESM